MPVVFRQDGFRFLFYSNEGNPREPPHIHAVKHGIDAKFWLWPTVRVAYDDGHGSATVNRLTTVVEQRRGEIARAWDEFFGEG